MSISFTTGINLDPQLKDLIDGLKKIDAETKETAWEQTQAIALGEEKMIKEDIPVDTGRAKASWGHFTPGDLVKGSSRIGKGKKITVRTRFQTGKGISSGDTQIATAGDAIWVENKSVMSITQGTRVPYTPYLNDGTSSHRALLFVERAEHWANNQMGKFSAALLKTITRLIKRRES